MNQRTNSGAYVIYVDSRSSAHSNGVVFSSAKGETLSSIVRNRYFYCEQAVYPSKIETTPAQNPEKINDVTNNDIGTSL